MLELMLDFHIFSIQTTYLLRVHCIPSMHGWSEVKTTEKVKVVFVEIQREL